MLVPGDTVPHFEVRTRQGRLFSYSSIWQRKNLLLVTLPTLDAGPTEAYIAELAARLQHVGEHDLEYVITRDLIPGISGSALLVGNGAKSCTRSKNPTLPTCQRLKRCSSG